MALYSIRGKDQEGESGFVYRGPCGPVFVRSFHRGPAIPRTIAEVLLEEARKALPQCQGWFLRREA